MCINKDNIDPQQLAAFNEFIESLEGEAVPTEENHKTTWSPLKTILSMIHASIEEGGEFHLQAQPTEEELQAYQAAQLQAQQQAALAQQGHGQVPAGIYPPNGAQPDVDDRPTPGNYL